VNHGVADAVVDEKQLGSAGDFSPLAAHKRRNKLDDMRFFQDSGIAFNGFDIKATRSGPIGKIDEVADLHRHQ